MKILKYQKEKWANIGFGKICCHLFKYTLIWANYKLEEYFHIHNGCGQNFQATWLYFIGNLHHINIIMDFR